MTGAQIYLIDISVPANRARYVAVNQGALLIGVSLGPGLGGLVAEVAGLRAPFFVVGVASGIAALYSWLRLPETRGTLEADDAHPHPVGDRATAPAGDNAPATASVSRGRQAWRFAMSRNFVAVGLVTMAIFTVRTGHQATLMPLLATERFELGPAGIGVIFVLSGLVGLVLIGPAAWIADTYGRKQAIVPTGLFAAAGMVVVAAAPTVALLVLGSMIMAVGSGVAGPAPAAYVADIAPVELRGVAMGMYRTSGDLGFLVAPPVVGWLADATSIGTAMVVNAAFVAAASIWFLVAATEPRRAGAGAAAVRSA
jgi:MFS family permease